MESIIKNITEWVLVIKMIEPLEANIDFLRIIQSELTLLPFWSWFLGCAWIQIHDASVFQQNI